MFNNFAHAGETHETVVESTAHALQWYVQIPIFFVAIFVFVAIIWLLTKKQDLTVLLSAFVMLIAGFVLFKIAPIISILSITLGLILTLLVTLLGLGDNSVIETDKKK